MKEKFIFFNHHPILIYFDTASTAQRPQIVLDAMDAYYTKFNANTGRGIYRVAEQATQAVEDVRQQVAQFIGALSSSEITFTQGTTASINLIAQSWALQHIRAGDEVVVTGYEHHANFIVWQQLCKKVGATFKVIPIDRSGQLAFKQLSDWINSKTKLIAITHVSNALGFENPFLKALITAAHQVGAKVLIDGAQAVKCIPVNVQDLGCDFYAFSGHKMYGPTGVGVLYVKKSVHPKMVPSMFGGGSVSAVTATETTFLPFPYGYESGTLPIAQIIGLGAAITYIQSIGIKVIQQHTYQLVNLLLDGLTQFKQINILGPQELLRATGTLVSFTIDGIHPHDVAAFLDTYQICVRAGHHCAQPLAQFMNYDASVRVSFGIYNNDKEVQKLIQAITELLKSQLVLSS
jgi:cysteine desulfurase / selenocysteine lyase